LLVESKSYEVMVVDNDIHQDSVKKLVQVFPKIHLHQLDVKDIHTRPLA